RTQLTQTPQLCLIRPHGPSALPAVLGCLHPTATYPATQRRPVHWQRPGQITQTPVLPRRLQDPSGCLAPTPAPQPTTHLTCVEPLTAPQRTPTRRVQTRGDHRGAVAFLPPLHDPPIQLLVVAALLVMNYRPVRDR